MLIDGGTDERLTDVHWMDEHGTAKKNRRTDLLAWDRWRDKWTRPDHMRPRSILERFGMVFGSQNGDQSQLERFFCDVCSDAFWHRFRMHF